MCQTYPGKKWRLAAASLALRVNGAKPLIDAYITNLGRGIKILRWADPARCLRIPRIVSGFVTWIGIALVEFAVYYLIRRHSGLATDRPPVTAV